MRIISNFNDYYDVGMSFGYDPKLQWIRKTTTISKTGRKSGSDQQTIYLTFCGKVYLGIKISGYNPLFYQKYFWDSDSYLKFCEINKLKPKQRNVHFWFKEVEQVLPGLTNIKVSEEDEEKYGSPVWVDYGDEIVVNPSLKELEFYKLFDPVTTYQMISMYFGNKFFSEPKTVEIADIYKVQQHGFDSKSFRKEPTKRSKSSN